MRIGLALTHPIEAYRSRPFRVDGGQGSRSGWLPGPIAPAPWVDGRDTALIAAFTSLEADLGDARISFAFEGDEFEMEDQRNWSDDSLKTFCTPLTRPAPFAARAGLRIAQSIELRVDRTPPPRRRVSRSIVLHDIDDGLIPRLGLGAASHPEPLTPALGRLLRSIRPAHLRVDLDPGRDQDWRARLQRARTEADVLGVPLEVGVVLDADALGLAVVAAALASFGQATIARLIALPRPDLPIGAMLADVDLVGRVRSALAAGGLSVPVVAGTDGSFAEVNRAIGKPFTADGIAVPINPTVHAWDDASVMRNLSVQAEIIAQTRRIAVGLPVHAGPIGLATRHGPYPCGPGGVGGLPSGVDPRQSALFAAAWTLGSLSQLATGGASTATLFETTGWHGVAERASGSPLPAQFPSRPGQAYPVLHVLADVASLHGVHVKQVEVPDATAVAVLSMAWPSGSRLLLANLQPRRQRVTIHGLRSQHFGIRVLDERTASRAAEDPVAFRALRDRIEAQGGQVDLWLGAYATARLDLDDAPGRRRTIKGVGCWSTGTPKTMGAERSWSDLRHTGGA